MDSQRGPFLRERKISPLVAGNQQLPVIEEMALPFTGFRNFRGEIPSCDGSKSLHELIVKKGGFQEIGSEIDAPLPIDDQENQPGNDRFHALHETTRQRTAQKLNWDSVPALDLPAEEVPSRSDGTYLMKQECHNTLE